MIGNKDGRALTDGFFVVIPTTFYSVSNGEKTRVDISRSRARFITRTENAFERAETKLFRVVYPRVVHTDPFIYSNSRRNWRVLARLNPNTYNRIAALM